MARIKTSNGYLEYKNHLLNFGSKVLNPDVMLENLRVLSLYLDKIDINWGPAFGTLIGIVRNDLLGQQIVTNADIQARSFFQIGLGILTLDELFINIKL